MWRSIEICCSNHLERADHDDHHGSPHDNGQQHFHSSHHRTDDQFPIRAPQHSDHWRLDREQAADHLLLG
jgi:hypothetical protein